MPTGTPGKSLQKHSYVSEFLNLILQTHSSDGKEPACNEGDLGWEDPLKEGMPTHSSILAWRTPWIEEPDGLQSMQWQRVRQD